MTIRDRCLLPSQVEQMRRQRSMLTNHLRDAVHSDDITRKVVTRGGDDVNAFMEKELDKHRKQVPTSHVRLRVSMKAT